MCHQIAIFIFTLFEYKSFIDFVVVATFYAVLNKIKSILLNIRWSTLLKRNQVTLIIDFFGKKETNFKPLIDFYRNTKSIKTYTIVSSLSESDSDISIFFLSFNKFELKELFSNL